MAALDHPDHLHKSNSLVYLDELISQEQQGREAFLDQLDKETSLHHRYLVKVTSVDHLDKATSLDQLQKTTPLDHQVKAKSLEQLDTETALDQLDKETPLDHQDKSSALCQPGNQWMPGKMDLPDQSILQETMDKLALLARHTLPASLVYLDNLAHQFHTSRLVYPAHLVSLALLAQQVSPVYMTHSALLDHQFNPISLAQLALLVCSTHQTPMDHPVHPERLANLANKGHPAHLALLAHQFNPAHQARLVQKVHQACYAPQVHPVRLVYQVHLSLLAQKVHPARLANLVHLSRQGHLALLDHQVHTAQLVYAVHQASLALLVHPVSLARIGYQAQQFQKVHPTHQAHMAIIIHPVQPARQSHLVNKVHRACMVYLARLILSAHQSLGEASSGQCAGSTTNIALNRPATQSSTWHKGVPGRAVDGNYSNSYTSNSCSHTKKEPNPWWRVDLGNSLCVDRVVVTKCWGKCCSERLEGFMVYVGDNPNMLANPTCGGAQTVRGKDVITVDCGRLTGRYVGIALKGSGRILTLCEVQVFGGSSNEASSAQFAGSTTNIALNRPAIQSSTWHKGVPGRAVDGDYSNSYTSNSCSHTKQEPNPWWRVDLGNSLCVDRVVVTKRWGKCCSERLEGFMVYVGDNPTCWPTLPVGERRPSEARTSLRWTVAD
ncbi:hypothetical protein Bbelb_065840 [Branchiostoma belcheri]|nr:hypothetical protein Bbelb_065840 [Branchiostoma belcheri]